MRIGCGSRGPEHSTAAPALWLWSLPPSAWAERDGVNPSQPPLLLSSEEEVWNWLQLRFWCWWLKKKSKILKPSERAVLPSVRTSLWRHALYICLTAASSSQWEAAGIVPCLSQGSHTWVHASDFDLWFLITDSFQKETSWLHVPLSPHWHCWILYSSNNYPAVIMLCQWTIEKKIHAATQNSVTCHISSTSGFCKWLVAFAMTLYSSLFSSYLERLHVENYSRTMWCFVAKSGDKSTEQRIQMVC